MYSLAIKKMNGETRQRRSGGLEIVINFPIETFSRISISLEGAEGRRVYNNDSKHKNNIRKPSVDKHSNTRLKVTMNGNRPNNFVSKILQTHGLLNSKREKGKQVLQTEQSSTISEESETQDNIEEENEDADKSESFKSEEEGVPEGTESVKTNIYDFEKPVYRANMHYTWCSLFPRCPAAAASECNYLHPNCKFMAACKRRNCIYSHTPNPPVDSPTPSAASRGALCKFYPHCKNPACRFLHCKICRYGKNCRRISSCKLYHDPRWTLSPALLGMYHKGCDAIYSKRRSVQIRRLKGVLK